MGSLFITKSAFLLLILLHPLTALIISEVQPANDSTLRDFENDTPDWVELYNNSAVPVNLDGYGLSDDPLLPMKWTFGNTVIQPGEYMIVFCSGKDLDLSQSSGKRAGGITLAVDGFSDGEGSWCPLCESWTAPLDYPGIVGQENGSNIVSIRLFRGDNDGINPWSAAGVDIYNKVADHYNDDNIYDVSMFTRLGVIANLAPGVMANCFILQEGVEPWLGYSFPITGTGTNTFYEIPISGNPWPLDLTRFQGIRFESWQLTNVIADLRVRDFYFYSNIPRYHTSFKLSSGGESVLLSDSSGTLLDYISWTDMKEDHSIGRGGGTPVVLLPEVAPCRAIVPISGADGLNWTLPAYNDSGWLSGFTGVGYENAAGYETLIGLDVLGSMYTINASVYIRIPFNITGVSNVVDLDLDIKYDDGFVAYLNGTHIAQLNSPATPFWNSGAPEQHVDSDALTFVTIELAPWLSTLTEGTNILAIHGLNNGTGSSDMLIRPRLRGVIATTNQSFKYFIEPSPGGFNSGISYSSILSPPEIITPAGFYTASVLVFISNTSPGSEIRYTVNGSVPKASSYLYTGPVNVSSNTVIRAACFLPDSYSEGTASASYFINDDPTLTVLSIATDPANLYDDGIGIYVDGTNGAMGFCEKVTPRNFNQEWERPVSFELFEQDGRRGLVHEGGIKVSGGCSRRASSKSFSIFARSEYGDNRMRYQFFGTNGADIFKSIMLRNSGQDWNNTVFRDALVQELIREHMEVDGQNYRPAVVFINGHYQGILNIRDKLNEHYLQYNHGVDKDNVDMLEETWEIVAGDRDHYNQMYHFLSNYPMSNQANYETMKAFMDMDEYIEYNIAQIYINNYDWPGNNFKMWRPRTNGGRWRWVLFDTDPSFGGWDWVGNDHNMLEHATCPDSTNNWPNPPSSTLLLRTLLENQEFRDDFIQRFAFFMSTSFLPQRALDTINEMSTTLTPEINRYIQRWKDSASLSGTPMQSFTEWGNNVSKMRDFALERPGYVKDHIKTYFGIPSMVDISLNSINGNIQVEHRILYAESWTGEFFYDVPLTLTAVADPGYYFVKWLDGPLAAERTIDCQSNTSLTAIFALAPLDIEGGEKLKISPSFVNLVTESSIKIEGIRTDSEYNNDPDKIPKIRIYNLNGELLAIPEYSLYSTLNGKIYASCEWDLKGPDGDPVPPGVYLVKTDRSTAVFVVSR